MIVASQYFHLECDHDRCKARTPSLDSEVAAWSDPVDLINSAADGEWVIKDGTHWCPDHVVWCLVCEDEIVPDVIKICDGCREVNDEKGGPTQQGRPSPLANYRRESHSHD